MSIGVTSGLAVNAEIVRKAGRKDGDTRERTGRRGKDLKRGVGIMNLFAPLGLEEESKERVVGSSRDDTLDQQSQSQNDHKKVDDDRHLRLEREEELGKREQEVKAREIAVRTREQHLDGRETLLAQRDRDIASRSSALDDRESAVSIRELGLAQRVLEREAELVTLEADVELCVLFVLDFFDDLL